MMRRNNDMPGTAFRYRVLQEIGATAMLLIEAVEIKRIAPASDTTEVRYYRLCPISILKGYMRPQGRGHQFYILSQCDNRIITTSDIPADFKHPPVIKFVQIEHLIELVIAGNNDNFFIVFGGPVPERMSGIVFVTNITDVAGKDKNIADHIQRIMFQITAVLRKLQMQI